MSKSINTRFFKIGRVTCLLVASLLVLLGSLVPSVPADAQTSSKKEKPTTDEANELSKQANLPDLRSKAESEGSVRVIVGLQADFPKEKFVPEGKLSRFEIADQRSAIGRAQAELRAELRGKKVQSSHEYKTIPYMALKLSPEALEAVGRSPRVTSIVEDLPEPVSSVEEDRDESSSSQDQSSSDDQEQLDSANLDQSVPRVQADDMWAAGYTGSGQTVAVLDTGIDKSHSFLSGKVIEEACFSAKSNCPNGSTSHTGTGSGVNCTYATSACKHGTHVAGIAAGKGDSFSGVAKGASLMSVQVFSRFTGEDCSSSGEDPCAKSYPSDQMKGLEQVFNLSTTHNIPSVNMSLGGGRYINDCDTDGRKPLIDNLKSAGIATVISSGNSGYTDSMGAPACISSAVSVGSTTDTDTVSSFSNSAPILSLLAPGSSINSSVPGGTFSSYNGTSMAAPHVAGAWALLRQAHPSQSVDTVRGALQSKGTGVKDTRVASGLTKPRINIFDSSTAIGGGDTTAPTVDESSLSPSKLQTGVQPNTNITATFSEEMNPGTLTASTVQLSQKYWYQVKKKKGKKVRRVWTYKWVPVTADVRCDEAPSPCKTATLDPASDLAANTTYSAKVTTGAKDMTGNALAQNYSWTFTTGSA